MKNELLEIAAKEGFPADKAADLFRAGVTPGMVELCRDRLKLDLAAVNRIYSLFGPSAMLVLNEAAALSKV